MNAIINSNNIERLKGTKIYITLFPCNNCVKMIIQSGIKDIVYLREKKDKREFIFDKKDKKKEIKAVKKMLEYTKINYWLV